MERLARLANNDKQIREELAAAGIPGAAIARNPSDDVPSSVAGQLGRFRFRRMSNEWSVAGDMPLAVAVALHEDDRNSWAGLNRPGAFIRRPEGRQIIVPRGFREQRGEHPEAVMVYKDADGAILEPEHKRIANPKLVDEIYGKRSDGKPSVRFVSEPSQEGKPFVIAFSIVHINGLKLFADVVRQQKLDA